jgi:hypothetical protein
LSNFKVSIGPNQKFFGATVSISVLGQTEFTLTNGTITSVDITGILTVPNGVDLNSIIKVSVGTYVTSIGGTAFQNAKNLTSITIPNTVTTISDYAFYQATILTTVTFAPGSKLDSIGENAFSGTSIGTIEIPASATSIGDSAFNGATRLSTLTFASGSQLKTIGANAFYQATSLTSIIIPGSVTIIGNFAFSGSGLKTVVFDSADNLTSLGKSNGFKYGTGQTFFGATGVTVLVLYSPNADDTKYYYPGVSPSQIKFETKGYNRCDVLVVGSGGNAGNSFDSSGFYFGFGGAGGGGGSASFTNIPCNPIDGNIEFLIYTTKVNTVPFWTVGIWKQNGVSLDRCYLSAGLGRDGSDTTQGSNGWNFGGGGAGGTADGNKGLLSSSVKLTLDTGGNGSKVTTPINSSSLPSVPSVLYGGFPRNLLSRFKAPATNSGKGSRNKFTKASIKSGDKVTYVNIPEDPPGAAFIQVTLYNVP